MVFSKWFGFIEAEDGLDYFVHASKFLEHDHAMKGDPVRFEINSSSRSGKPEAVNVTLIKPHEAAIAASVFSKSDVNHAEAEAAAAFRIDARYT